jgi:hypothetical protein
LRIKPLAADSARAAAPRRRSGGVSSSGVDGAVGGVGGITAMELSGIATVFIRSLLKNSRSLLRNSRSLLRNNRSLLAMELSGIATAKTNLKKHRE